MALLQFNDNSSISRAAGLTLVLGLSLAASEPALAASHLISAQAGGFDCGSVRPGDTVILGSGVRGPLKIRNCSGTEDTPITITNDANGTRPTTISRSSGASGGFVFSCDDCVGVVIDGSTKWRGAPSGQTYGIKVTMTGGESPSAFMRIGGMSRFVTIRSVEIDGTWPALAKNGIGLSVNDHSIQRAAFPTAWREGYKIERNYIHNIEGEGMYVGPNYREGDLPLRNIEISYNLLEDIGWEGINTKSLIAGNNSIHHNVIRRAGKNDSQSSSQKQYAGVNNNSGSVSIFNNWIESTGTHGIKLGSGEGPLETEGFGPFEARVWNNVIVSAGELWSSFMPESHGISVSSKVGVEKPVPYIYSNTIVSPRNDGINLASNVGSGYVKDNVIAGAGGVPVKAPSFVSLTNNRAGSVSDMLFVDAPKKNFRLRADSPARNRAGSDYPDSDFDDVPRPQDGAADQGAFEFTTNPAASRPNAPDSVTVE